LDRTLLETTSTSPSRRASPDSAIASTSNRARSSPAWTSGIAWTGHTVSGATPASPSSVGGGAQPEGEVQRVSRDLGRRCDVGHQQRPGPDADPRVDLTG